MPELHLHHLKPPFDRWQRWLAARHRAKLAPDELFILRSAPEDAIFEDLDLTIPYSFHVFPGEREPDNFFDFTRTIVDDFCQAQTDTLAGIRIAPLLARILHAEITDVIRRLALARAFVENHDSSVIRTSSDIRTMLEAFAPDLRDRYRYLPAPWLATFLPRLSDAVYSIYNEYFQTPPVQPPPQVVLERSHSGTSPATILIPEWPGNHGRSLWLADRLYEADFNILFLPLTPPDQAGIENGQWQVHTLPTEPAALPSRNASSSSFSLTGIQRLLAQLYAWKWNDYRQAIAQYIPWLHAIMQRFNPDILLIPETTKWFLNAWFQTFRQRQRPILAVEEMFEEIEGADFMLATSHLHPRYLIRTGRLQSERFAVTGDLMLSVTLREKLQSPSSRPLSLDGISPDRKILLYAADPGDYVNTPAQKSIDERTLIEAVSHRPQWHLILKLHPQDSGRITSAILRHPMPDNITVIADESRGSHPQHYPHIDYVQHFDMTAAMRHADLIIATYSTTVKEAVALDKPVAVLDLHNLGYYRYVTTTGEVPRLTSRQEIHDLLDSPLPSPNYPKTRPVLGIVDNPHERLEAALEKFRKMCSFPPDKKKSDST
ncbi:MAG: hypothetical protein D6820_11100 [Lentisphaerae bacterium]|nr:MAG: hypothetical protein D6820_11100 [Lentisphaerota bacterium]